VLAGPTPRLRSSRGPLFELERVVAARDGRPVLRGLDLELRPGATALLGPSGSGKSTLLRLLNRLADADEGTIRYRGEDVRSLDPLDLRRSASLVPQLPAPLPGTVAENVRYGPRLRGDEVDAGRPLEQAGLGPSYADRDASRLSVGEQQRVMLARALALEPDVLLLDEPTSALDETARDGVEATLHELGHSGGRSMVIVTHDRGQAERLADRVVRIKDGRIE
jgi:ABC-type multidrug transport system ATPase subunit